MFTAMLESITTLLQPWADFHAEHTGLATAIVAAHLLGLFVGGGIAIGADRRVLLAQPGSNEAYVAAGADLAATHGVVLVALTVTVLSGLALAAADAGTFGTSPVFWSKMIVFGLLLVNGMQMRRTERRIMGDGEPALPWNRLRRSARLSIGGWLLLVVLGVVLANT